jgi:hypothetical protein
MATCVGEEGRMAATPSSISDCVDNLYEIRCRLIDYVLAEEKHYLFDLCPFRLYVLATTT